MKYLFIVKSEYDPATRYRVWPLEDKLKILGCQVSILSSKSSLFELVKKIRATDVVIVQRKLFTKPVIRIIRYFSKTLIYDFDDAIFLRSNGESSPIRMARFQAIASRADQVWAGNSFLAEQAGRFNTNVQLVPTSVDIISYGAEVTKEETFTLVWIGSSSTRKYLESFRQVLEEIGKSVPEIQLKVISDFEFSLENLKVINQPWSQAAEISDLKSCHVGIAPMTDNPWTRGKCALKVLQYMAASLPVISSSVGANSEVISNDETGILASGSDDWKSAVEALANSESKRNQMGKAGRQKVEEIYASNVITDRLLNYLDLESSEPIS